ncbi:MAG: hypothetical protein Tsb0020_26920 [Haliangiales bacterium]
MTHAPRRLAHALLATLAPLALTALAALIALTAAPSWAQAAPEPGAGGLRVAVLEFANTSTGDGLDVLGKGLQSMVTTDLTGASALTLIERARLRDIERELALGGSGMIDAKTAARVGKMAGASHLLGGTFTVYGDSMRIDARLFSVEAGTVLLAEEITGDREAFFELEKALVRKLLRALGVKLAPAERTRIAQIHTADFEAFRRFSQGVAHFDDERYQQAIAALEQATAIDGAFDLARVTLSEYTRVASEIRARAATIASSKAEVARLAADKQARDDDAVAARLFEIAERGAGGKLDPAAQLDRITALALLHILYRDGFYSSYHGRYMRYRQRRDAFTVKRMADLLLQRYLAASRRAFPAVPLFPPPLHGEPVPDSLEDFDAEFEKAREHLSGARRPTEADSPKGLFKNLQRVDSILKHLPVDAREELALRELALDRASALAAKSPELDRADLEDMIAALAVRYRNLADFDRSTALFARLSGILNDPDDLEAVARQVEHNRALATMRRQTRLKRAFDEYLSAPNSWGDRQVSIAPELLSGRAPSPALLYRLMETRQLREMRYWLWNQAPCWVYLGRYWLLTGERSGPRSASALRYYHTDRMSEEDALVGCGLAPRRDFTASFTIDYRPAGDFWPRHTSAREVAKRSELVIDTRQPEVGFVFALRGLDPNTETDPETGSSRIREPTHGLMLRFTASAVELVALGELGPSKDIRRDRMATQVLAKEAVKLDRERPVKVSVRVRGGRIQVDLGRGRKFSFAWPKSHTGGLGSGFYGFHVRGHGYAEIAAPQVK